MQIAGSFSFGNKSKEKIEWVELIDLVTDRPQKSSPVGHYSMT